MISQFRCIHVSERIIDQNMQKLWQRFPESCFILEQNVAGCTQCAHLVFIYPSPVRHDGNSCNHQVMIGYKKIFYSKVLMQTVTVHSWAVSTIYIGVQALLGKLTHWLWVTTSGLWTYMYHLPRQHNTKGWTWIHQQSCSVLSYCWASWLSIAKVRKEPILDSLKKPFEFFSRVKYGELLLMSYMHQHFLYLLHRQCMWARMDSRSRWHMPHIQFYLIYMGCSHGVLQRYGWYIGHHTRTVEECICHW